jgi:predicted nucleotidyltransferase
MNPKIQTILSQLKNRLQSLYGDRLVNLVLFGSQARGDAVCGSDIDVLVVLTGPVKLGEEIKRTGHIAADLSLQNDEVISCLFMEKEHFLNRQGPLLRNIRKEGVIL